MRKEKTYQETLLEELEQSSRVLQAAINDLIRKRESLVGDFKKFKGRLPWPVEGDVITQFGKQKHEKFNTYIFSKGIDIEARKGKDVRAVHDGSVLFADWFKGYGKMLILDHGRGFYSLYAHLSEIVVPNKSTVTKGQPVGTVGETGSLQGPLLYFEIRHHGKPEDPLVWLTRR
jgi:septal ring factor EnvC (AmiA/AmiB activator)